MLALDRYRGIRLFFFVACCSMIEPAYGDCQMLGAQTKSALARLPDAAMEYQSAVARLAMIPDQLQKIAQGIAINSSLVNALDQAIDSLDSGKRDGCFGSKSQQWDSVIADLSVKRSALLVERDVLLTVQQRLTSTQFSAKRVDWAGFLAPSLKSFAACVILKKRVAISLADKKPTPSDFSLIIIGACNTEAANVEGEENKIEGWTNADTKKVSEALHGIRQRVISEYTEQYYGKSN